MNDVSIGLVIGYGSVGRRHAKVLASITPALAIVEMKAPARTGAAQDHPAARVVDRLEALDAAEFPWNETIAVIATWGPSHAELFHALADRGVRHILCEKPMAASIHDAQMMVERAEREGITLAVHHYLRYAGLAQALQDLFAAHDLGAPVALVVEGGACCLLTNGIHWLDFACQLFEGVPQQVISTASGEPINPRAPDLMIYAGTVILNFGQRREAVIAFNNGSSVALSARIYLRDAVVDLDGDLRVSIRRRDRAAVEKFPAITRTGPASELLFEGMLPGVLSYFDGIQAALHDAASNGSVTCSGSHGAAAVSACIGALLSGRERRAVDLPIEAASSWGQERWPIS